MKVLLVGNRSIQHLLAERLEFEGCSAEVYPGQKLGQYTCVTSEQVLGSSYDLVVMGSARYFDDPVISELKSRGVPYFGPDHLSGRLETSKEQFKKFANKYRIPTPVSATFTNYELAVKHLRTLEPPYVIKADGPARGCGVAICHNREDAKRDLKRKLSDKSSLYYCERVIVERFVNGFEVAINVFIDGADYVLFPATKPHKRRNDKDSGSIVAGMGSVAPILLDQNFYKEFEGGIIKPTIDGISREGWNFRGCLFVNLMLTDNEVTVLEFNCRMGDPAMLVDLVLLKSKVIDLLVATSRGKLSSIDPTFRKGAAAAVTLIDRNYPEGEIQPSKFDVDVENFFDFQSNSGLVIAGAELDSASGKMLVNSGVVATAIALGVDCDSAIGKANLLASSLPQFHSRSDIGTKRIVPGRYSIQSIY